MQWGKYGTSLELFQNIFASLVFNFYKTLVRSGTEYCTLLVFSDICEMKSASSGIPYIIDG